MKATKIGEIRRLSAKEKHEVPEGILNQQHHIVQRSGWLGTHEVFIPRSKMTKREEESIRASIEEMIAYPRDYRITWTAKVNKSLQNAEGNGTVLFGGLQDEFTHELEKASQQQPTLITIAEESLWLYQDSIYRAPLDLDPEEILLLIKEQELQKTKRLEKLRRLVEVSETLEKASSRERIPEEVQMFVWRRDGAKCVKCGSQENLEFDHVIPVSKGGANTNRNIQLLCEACNRSKSDKI